VVKACDSTELNHLWPARPRPRFPHSLRSVCGMLEKAPLKSKLRTSQRMFMLHIVTFCANNSSFMNG
jgi:hypothetical protein